MSMATDVVDAQIEAYQARDVERFLSHYADDVSVVLTDSPDLRVTIASRMTAGDFVVDEERLSGIHFGDMATEMTALSVYRVADGKISKLMLLF